MQGKTTQSIIIYRTNISYWARPTR